MCVCVLPNFVGIDSVNLHFLGLIGFLDGLGIVHFFCFGLVFLFVFSWLTVNYAAESVSQDLDQPVGNYCF